MIRVGEPAGTATGDITNVAFDSGVGGTPTVAINGTVLKNAFRAGVLRDALDRITG